VPSSKGQKPTRQCNEISSPAVIEQFDSCKLYVKTIHSC